MSKFYVFELLRSRALNALIVAEPTLVEAKNKLALALREPLLSLRLSTVTAEDMADAMHKVLTDEYTDREWPEE